MKRIDIKLGYTCNNSCKFCIIGENRYKFKDKKLNKILNEIKDAKKRGFEKLLLTGGEPTIRKDFLKILTFANKLKFKKIHIESNGRMFKYYNFTKKCIENGANSFSISFYASNKEDYEKISRTNGFDEVINGIINLKKFNANISINCTINKINHNKLLFITKLCKQLNVDNINFPYINSQGYAKKFSDEIFINLFEIKSSLKKALDYAKNNNLSATTEMVPLCILKGNEKSCFELYDKRHEINAVEYINKDFMKSIKEGRIKVSSCKKCKYYYFCVGIVNDINFNENKRFLKPILGKKIKKIDEIIAF